MKPIKIKFSDLRSLVTFLPRQDNEPERFMFNIESVGSYNIEFFVFENGFCLFDSPSVAFVRLMLTNHIQHHD